MRNWIDLVEDARHGIPDEVVEKYTNGDCMWLALAMNKRYGWPIKAQMERDATYGDYVAHAYCVMPDGREIDILGPKESVDIYSTDVQDWAADDLLATIGSDHHEIVRKMAEADAAIDQWIDVAPESTVDTAAPLNAIN